MWTQKLCIIDKISAATSEHQPLVHSIYLRSGILEPEWRHILVHSVSTTSPKSKMDTSIVVVSTDG